MTKRTYARWRADAVNAKRSTMELAEELRACWPDWKAASGYATWEECCLAELGITAATVRSNRRYANDLRARANSHGTEDPQVDPLEFDDEVPMEPRIERAVQLAAQGQSYRAIASKVGLHKNTVRLRPEVRTARLRANPEAHASTNYSNPMVCRIEAASTLIGRVEGTLTDLLCGNYTLTTRDRKRLRAILTDAIGRLEQ